MKISELFEKLSNCDPNTEVFVSQTFISKNHVKLREIEVNANGIVLKDHYSRIEPIRFKAYDGGEYIIPNGR